MFTLSLGGKVFKQLNAVCELLPAQLSTGIEWLSRPETQPCMCTLEKEVGRRLHTSGFPLNHDWMQGLFCILCNAVSRCCTFGQYSSFGHVGTDEHYIGATEPIIMGGAHRVGQWSSFSLLYMQGRPEEV